MKENIFPAVFEIVDQARTMTAALERMEKEERKIAADYCDLYEQEMKAGKGNRDFSKLKTAREDKERKLSENQTAKTQIKILLAIFHDNAQAKAAETMKHYIAGILHKLEGKKPGPKTAEKIKEAFYSATGCSLYFHGTGKNSYIGVYPDCTFFRSGDFEFTAAEGITTDDNKIIAHTAEELKNRNAVEYCEDPAQRVDEIVAAFKAIKAAEDEMQAKIKAFNDLLPANINSIHVSGSRNYIVV